MEIQGQAAIVTGGASGLGAATATALAAAGAKVTLFDLDTDKGKAHAGMVGGLFACVDVSDEDSVIAGLDQAEAAHGPARILVNCAGIAPGAKTVGKDGPHSLDLYRKVIMVNLVGSFNCLRLAAARMVALDPVGEPAMERGVIINTASIAAYEGQIGQAAYASSKGGVVGMTLACARDLARDHVRVNSIAPGIFKTPMVAGLPENVQESLAATIPNPPRLGDPAEFAALVRHLIENSMMNGETVRIDGALRMAPR